MKPSEVSCGLAHEVAITLAKAGWEVTDLDALAKNEECCREILPFLRGNAKITIVEHVIDCSVAPFCPEKWEVLPPEEQISTRLQGQLKWNRENQKTALYLSEKQTTGEKWIEGNKLRKELAGQVVLPANVLDYQLANPNLIPEEWKGKAVFFWGTIYRDSDGGLYVRCLCWGGSRWNWGYSWLGLSFDSRLPAALPASQN